MAMYPADETVLWTSFYRILQEMNDETLQILQWTGPCLDLPQHVSSMAEIDDKIKLLGRYLSKIQPACVTIATSSIVDEYTPSSQSHYILKNLLDLLRSIYPEFKLKEKRA